MTIIVVGAGVVGWAIAYELVSRGAHVRIIDARGTGRGATRASAGILAPHIEGHLPALHTLAVRSLALYDRFVATAAADSGQAIEYDRAGTVQVAGNADELAALCRMAASLADAQVDHVVLDSAGIRQLEPHVQANLAGGLFIRDHGYVNAGALTRAIAAAAMSKGVAMTTTAVRAIEGGEKARVVTTDEELSVDAVVIAAGSWSSALASEPTTAVRPIRGQLIQLRASERLASHVIWGTNCYLVPWRDGTMLVGATVEDVGFDEKATASAVQQLLAAGIELMPSLRDAAFEEARVGLRPMTADELPAIGPSSTMRHVFYATGHYRNGVLLAPLTAALVADLVLERREREELALVRPARLGL